MQAQGPDGTIFDFPDDTPEEVMGRTIASHYATQANPTADAAQALAGGAERGAVGTLGLAGDLQSAADFAARQTVGRLYNRFAPGGTGTWEADTRPDPNLAPVAKLPGSQDVISAYESLRGPTYRPQTTAGQVAGTVGEFLGGSALVPGAALPKAVGAVAGGLGAEAGGQAAEALGHPELAGAARLAGAVAAPALAGRAITPFRTDPERLAAAQALRQEGVPVSAGQQTGSKFLQFSESALGESPMGVAPAANQQERFNAAVGRRMGIPDAEALTAEVMHNRAQEISRGYREVLARNPLDVDLPLTQDLVRVAERYGDRVALAQRPQFARDMDLLRTEIQRQGGQLTGDQYQQLRSTFAQRARDFQNTDGAYANANREVRRALDAAWERSATAAGNDVDVAFKRDLDRNYRAQDTITKALAQSPRQIEGDVSPFAIANTARASAGTAAAVRGQDDLANLANAGRTLMRQAPNSGTVNRAQALALPGALGLAGASTMNPILGLGGWLAPGLASQVINRAPAQRYLGNTLLNQGVLSGAQALVNAQKALGTDRRRGILGGR